MKRALSFTLLAGLLVAVLVQLRTTAELRRERASLANAARDAERLARENAEIPALRAEVEEVQRLRAANQELHTLRNEVTQLRRVQPELAAQRVESKRLKTERAQGFKQPLRLSERPGYVARAALTPVGFATPEATVQTWFWTMREADLKRIAECFPSEKRQERLKNFETQSESQNAEFIRVTQQIVSAGYRIVDKATISPSEALVRIQFNEVMKPRIIPLIRYGDEWKLGPGGLIW